MATRRLLLIPLLLCACQSTPSDPLLTLPTPTNAEKVMLPTLTQKAMAVMSAAPAIRGVIRRLNPPTSCKIDGGVLPYCYPDWSEPRAGKLLRIQWVTRAMRPFEGEPAVLLVSTEPAAPLNLTPFGHEGCWLMVRPDWLLAPTQEGLLTSPSPGVLELNWVLPEAFVGMTWRAQLVVFTGATRSGWAVDSGVEFTIGSPEVGQ
jgi:hypothetical protein